MTTYDTSCPCFACFSNHRKRSIFNSDMHNAVPPHHHTALHIRRHSLPDIMSARTRLLLCADHTRVWIGGGKQEAPISFTKVIYGLNPKLLTLLAP